MSKENALNKIVSVLFMPNDDFYTLHCVITDRLATFKSKLLTKDNKTLKASKIMEEKGVNMLILILTEDVEEYNFVIMTLLGKGELTQEEYRLLKECLGEEKNGCSAN